MCQWKVRPHEEEGYCCGLYSKWGQANLQCQLWSGADRPPWEKTGRKFKVLEANVWRWGQKGVADKH